MLANPGSSGTRSTPSSRTRSPRRARGICSSPLIQTRDRSEAAPSAHSTRWTWATADHPNVAAEGSVCRTPSIVTRCGASRARSEVSSPRSCRPLQPTPSARTPATARAPVATGVPAPTRRAATARTTSGSSGTRRARASAPGRSSTRAAQEPRSRDGEETDPEEHRRIDPDRQLGPEEEAGGERRRGDRQHPGAHDGSSDRDLVADLLERGGPDPAHVHQVVDGGERTVLVPILDDRRGEHLADAGERLQLGRRGRVDVDQAARRAAGRRPPERPAPGGPAFGTRIWVPSASGAARFRRLRSAFGIWPPARSIASITRSPSANS